MWKLIENIIGFLILAAAVFVVLANWAHGKY
jgi:hypothetical protein